MADQTTPSAREHIETALLGDDLDLDRELARLAALGSPTRFTIMHYLVTTGPTATTDLATQLDHSPTAFADDIQKLPRQRRHGTTRVFPTRRVACRRDLRDHPRATGHRLTESIAPCRWYTTARTWSPTNHGYGDAEAAAD